MESFAARGAGWERDEVEDVTPASVRDVVEDVRELDPRTRARNPGTRDAKAQLREEVGEGVCDSPLMVRADGTSAVGAVR
jgi:hypothetical protein